LGGLKRSGGDYHLAALINHFFVFSEVVFIRTLQFSSLLVNYYVAEKYFRSYNGWQHVFL
jgi:hypothetical protein